MRRVIVRPKKMRNKTSDEPNNPHILSRRLPTGSCKKYGDLGHNKRSCKWKRAVDREMHKGGNNTNKEKITKGGKGKKKTNETRLKLHKDLKQFKLLNLLKIT